VRSCSFRLFRTDHVRDPEQDAEEDQGAGDQPQGAEDGLDLILEQQPQHDDRDRADDDQPAHPGVRVGARDAPDERTEPLPHDAHDVTPEEERHRRLRADLRDGGERGARVLRVGQEGADDAQVRAG
jgi:hypothetical protein